MKISLEVKFTLSYNEAMSSLAQKLKAKGLKATDVAEKAGVSQSYLSMLMNGQRSNPSAQTITRLVQASDGALSVEDFMSGSAA